MRVNSLSVGNLRIYPKARLFQKPVNPLALQILAQSPIDLQTTPVRSIYLCGTGIIAEQAAEALPAFNETVGATFFNGLWEEKNISLSLMISLTVEMPTSGSILGRPG